MTMITVSGDATGSAPAKSIAMPNRGQIFFNTMLALRGDDRLGELFTYNQMERSAILNRPVPGQKGANGQFTPHPVSDTDVSALRNSCS